MRTPRRLLDYSSGTSRIDPREVPEEPGPMQITGLPGTSIVCSATALMFCGAYAYAHHDIPAGEPANPMSMIALFMLTIATVLLLAAWSSIPYTRLHGPRRRRDAVLALAAAMLALTVVAGLIVRAVLVDS